MATLVVYFSRTGENYVNGAIRSLTVGNTEIVAKMIQAKTGASVFQIVPQINYSDDYNECIEQAKDDQKRNARPELVSYPDGMERYDAIYLGFPNYWGTMPMCVFTFLEHYNFDGKRIYPFCTHEGSGMGRSVTDIKELCPGAKVDAGLAIHGAEAGRADTEVSRWLSNH